MTKLLSNFQQDLELRGLTKNTIYNTVGSVRAYLCWSESQRADPLSIENLLAYLKYIRTERSLKSTTVERHFQRIGLWFEFLEEMRLIESNPMPRLRKRYLRSYKDPVSHRRLISVEEAARMVRATIDTRDRAMLMLLFKTGVRRHELVALDVDDVDIEKLSILLKPTPKRSNRIVYFDEETARVLKRWLTVRASRLKKRGERALFLSRTGTRMRADTVFKIVAKAAERVGLHDPRSNRPEDHFSPHCCRHWFTTHLIRSGMPRDYIKWLRGDAMNEAIDIYNHIDPEDVKRSYLAHIPMLGV
ncbi:MAG: tyrosine-type recombinase/integrase [Methanothrix sp.]|uniref:tyrosine-type recombinase/integrase n=1 Tax=Methanothrix sp. TaxID=90426 RepID=UPI0032AF682A|nr:tyrosine-type recombinase/integrase [Methanothrix sp.]